MGTGLIRIFVLRYQRFENEFVRFVRSDVTEGLKRIDRSIDDQAQQFVEAVSSLEAMRESRVSRMYASRLQASTDIARGDQPAPHGAWQHLEGLIRGQDPASERGGGLDIKVRLYDSALPPHKHHPVVSATLW
ncbi:hypothetical protein ACGFNU_39095 [Spirillospora sp. NPDC048911]|uniref:hypothetical protein n=1 Tax=Spirillospora sp. NPDC048911 TaxID=3364527 RepID=UPI00371D1706